MPRNTPIFFNQLDLLYTFNLNFIVLNFNKLEDYLNKIVGISYVIHLSNTPI